MENQLTLWDWPKNFCNDKADLRSHPSFGKTYTVFMINRILSMSPKTCGLALFMTLYPDIPKEQHFAFLNAEVDRENIFFNYAKENREFEEKILYSIQQYWNCSRSRALEYARLLSEKQLDTVIEVISRRDADAKKRKVRTKKK